MTARPSGLCMATRVLILAAMAALLCSHCVESVDDASPAVAKKSSELQRDQESTTDDVECSSLSGPFCAYTGSLAFFEAYMTPISLIDLQQGGSEVSRRPIRPDEGVANWQRKRCFFQHYAGSWMDAGSDANDLMNQPVASVDECEQLCCDHPRCSSFTFWRGRTCFLRASSKAPHHDTDSFSGIRLI